MTRPALRALPIPAAPPSAAQVALWMRDVAAAHGQPRIVPVGDDTSGAQARTLALHAAADLCTGPERDLLNAIARALLIEVKGHGYTDDDLNDLDAQASAIRWAADELAARLEMFAARLDE